MSAVNPDQKTADLIEKLVETTQDIFIFQALGSGLTKETVRRLLRVNNDRITRVSKILPKKSRTNGVEK
jgi:hypothetical protein